MKMLYHVCFIAAGYLSGSILFARVSERIFEKEIVDQSSDHNPGTANAFMRGGVCCGVLTLLGDLLKGFFPIFLYLRFCKAAETDPVLLSLVLAAPVIGHILPAFYGFKGGKGIAATFGVLLGLVPSWVPVGTFIAAFIFYSVIVQITPHFYRTIVSYATALILMAVCRVPEAVFAGTAMITLAVCLQLHRSTEERKKCKVRFLWKR